jgi:hypothetical protein
MKLRHAAALALVGWYLMVAPTSGKEGDPESKFLFHAPLSKWRQLGEFDSATECNEQREKWVTTVLSLSSDTPEGTWALCVATDDPRLKGK